MNWSKFSFAEVCRRILRYFGLRLSIGLAAAIGALLLFRWLAEEVFEGETKSFDDAIRAAIHQTATPTLTELMKVITLFGSTAFLVALGIVVAFAFWYFKHKRAIVLFLLTMAGEIVLLLSLKAGFQRARPEAFFDFPLPSSYSFPSGHALSSLCFYGILAWLITARLQSRSMKIIVWTLTIILILLIGFSRIYLGVHIPSDVIAGYAAGLIWVVTVALGDFLLEREIPLKKEGDNLPLS